MGRLLSLHFTLSALSSTSILTLALSPKSLPHPNPSSFDPHHVHKVSHCKESIGPAFGEEEHWGADNADDEPLAKNDEATDVATDATTATNETMADAATDDVNANASAGDAANANATSADATTDSSAVRYFFGLFLKLFPKFFNVC